MLADAARARRRRPDPADRGAPARRARRARRRPRRRRRSVRWYARGSGVAERRSSMRSLPRAWRRESAWHGEVHWRCVTATGLALGDAGTTRVDRALVFCFGLLHDTRRVNEAVDREHGPRAAEFARRAPRGRRAAPRRRAFAALTEALGLHSDGRVSADPTIGTCWDADRLHLPRVSIVPDPALLSTQAALEPRAARPRRSCCAGRPALVGRAGRARVATPCAWRARSAGSALRRAVTGERSRTPSRGAPSEHRPDTATTFRHEARHRRRAQVPCTLPHGRRAAAPREPVADGPGRRSAPLRAGSRCRWVERRRARRSRSSSRRSGRRRDGRWGRPVRSALRARDAPVPDQGAGDGGDSRSRREVIRHEERVDGDAVAQRSAPRRRPSRSKPKPSYN